MTERKPTLFYGVPTLYAAMLADPNFPKKDALALRICISAGEALPPQISKGFKEKTGLDILDGIGSTEMLHIFLSNRPGDFRYGTTGKAVPGYELRLVDEQGESGEAGRAGRTGDRGLDQRHVLLEQPRQEPLHLHRARGRRAATSTLQDADGFYVYGGRTDDMLKVGGIWVSPAEVEAALVSPSRRCSRRRWSARKTSRSW